VVGSQLLIFPSDLILIFIIVVICLILAFIIVRGIKEDSRLDEIRAVCVWTLNLVLWLFISIEYRILKWYRRRKRRHLNPLGED